MSGRRVCEVAPSGGQRRQAKRKTTLPFVTLPRRVAVPALRRIDDNGRPYLAIHDVESGARIEPAACCNRPRCLRDQAIRRRP